MHEGQRDNAQFLCMQCLIFCLGSDQLIMSVRQRQDCKWYHFYSCTVFDTVHTSDIVDNLCHHLRNTFHAREYENRENQGTTAFASCTVPFVYSSLPFPEYTKTESSITSDSYHHLIHQHFRNSVVTAVSSIDQNGHASVTGMYNCVPCFWCDRCVTGSLLSNWPHVQCHPDLMATCSQRLKVNMCCRVMSARQHQCGDPNQTHLEPKKLLILTCRLQDCYAARNLSISTTGVASSAFRTTIHHWDHMCTVACTCTCVGPNMLYTWTPEALGWTMLTWPSITAETDELLWDPDADSWIRTVLHIMLTRSYHDHAFSQAWYKCTTCVRTCAYGTIHSQRLPSFPLLRITAFNCCQNITDTFNAIIAPHFNQSNCRFW